MAVEGSARGTTASWQEGLVAGAGRGVYVLCARGTAWSPAENGVDGGAAGVDLKGDRKGDEEDNGCFGDGRSQRLRV